MSAVSREIPSSAEAPGVALAIDYGRKRLGLALSDELGMISRPFAIWIRTNRRRDLARLRELVRQHDVRRIVVGLPLHADGAASEMSAEAQAFAARVQKALGRPVEMMDERLTSWEAGQAHAAGKPARTGSLSNRPLVDDRAAALILRDYLEHPSASRKIDPSTAGERARD